MTKGTTPMEKRLLTISETAEVLNIGRTKTYELVAGGRLCSVRIGSRRYVPVQKLDDYLDGLVLEYEAG